MRRVASAGLAWWMLSVWGSGLGAEEPRDPETPDFATKVAGMERREGLLAFYVDPADNHVWLELPPGASGALGEYIYVEGLATGLGSNPVGLDRGQLGDARLIVLRRVGGRLVIEQPNLAYRALTEDADEATATRQSFATSILWSGPIGPLADDGRALVDLTSFLVRDAHGVVRRLAETGQGEFALDPERSLVDLDACLAFPDNLEFEALLTYAADKEIGDHVRSTAPSPEAITLVQHHSLVRLPEPGYTPREFDPRAGSFAIAFHDYAAPLTAPIERRWIVRHRLTAGDSLVYYVDRGAPEPIRSALLDGARWWAEAFAAAGFPDAFRVELMPAGAHPLDVRYNVIQWVHRSTRGWSYGGGVVDPRTGEMLKGHVSLGSLRVRQDRLIFEGLVGADKSGSGAPDDPVELALARIRQLSAHEVGHTLGITHNFAASTYGRESVMDYPAPLVSVDADGNLDLSAAYATGIGKWDIHAIRFAYTELDGDEAAALERLLAEGRAQGLEFITDQDARPPGAAHATGSLWDNGSDAVAQLETEMAVRRIALERFGADRVARGAPLALLEEVLATVYFRHRYQLEAAVKRVGGFDYRYALRGDGQPMPRPVAAAEQLRALGAVLATLDPGALDLPESTLAVLHPRPFGYSGNRELIRGHAAPAFDPLGAAATAADMAVSMLLQPERAARLVNFHHRDPSLPGFADVLDALLGSTFATRPGEAGRALEIRRAVRGVVVDALIALASNPEAALPVRVEAEAALRAAAARLAGGTPGTGPGPHERYLASRIDRFLDRPAPVEAQGARAPDPPPGSPIGGARSGYRLGGCSLDAALYEE